MRNLGISIFIMAFIVGCGNSSSKGKSTALNFNTSDAKYDLTSYLQVNSLAIYKNNASTKTGTAPYAGNIETYPTLKSNKVADTISLKNENDIDVGNIKILTDKLERTFKIGEKSQTIDIVRNFSIGDYIANSKSIEKALDAEVELNRICQTEGIIKKKTINTFEYENLLEIECVTSSKLIKETAQVKEATVDKTETIYMAKGKGIVFNENETCTSITSVILEVENTVKVCKKNVKEMLSFNAV